MRLTSILLTPVGRPKTHFHVKTLFSCSNSHNSLVNWYVRVERTRVHYPPVLFGMLAYLMHGFMCNGIWEFHTGNMHVSVWRGQRVGTCSVHFVFFFLMFPPFFLVVCVLRGQYIPGIIYIYIYYIYIYIYTLRGFYELTQAWLIISVAVSNTLASVPIGRTC